LAGIRDPAKRAERGVLQSVFSGVVFQSGIYI
jgi:hypothetical protein